MDYKYLLPLILLALTACHESKEKCAINCGEQQSKQSAPVEKAPSIADIVAPQEQWVRMVKADYKLDGKTLSIENLGWCQPYSGQTGRIEGDQKCYKVFDYSKINENGKVSYLYREVSNVAPFEKLKSTYGIISTKTSSSKKWENSVADFGDNATVMSVARNISLNEWKYSLNVLHKLHTSRCKASRHYQKVATNSPLTQNRLLNTDNIFYFDIMFNGVTTIEIDLKKSKIVGFPLLLDSHKDPMEFDWNSQSKLNGRNNEITEYESDVIDLSAMIVSPQEDWFITNCGIYYNSTNNKISVYQNPSLAFFPTYNSKYDQEISNEVDKILEFQKGSDGKSTDYKPILTKEEVDRLIPAKENIPKEALNFLLKDSYEIYTLDQFKRGL